jgi:hypothetical protein
VQFVLSAATISTHGKYSVDQYLQKRFPRAERLLSESFHKHHPRIEQDFLHVDLLGSGVLDGEGAGERGSGGRGADSCDDADGGVASVASSVMTPARVDLVFRALVGALPPRSEGEEEGEEEDSRWHRDQWKHTPIDVQAISPTMIFANSASKAKGLAAALVQHGGGVLAGTVAEFHKLVPTYEKQEALAKFRDYQTSGVRVLVCTDAAAR